MLGGQGAHRGYIGVTFRGPGGAPTQMGVSVGASLLCLRRGRIQDSVSGGGGGGAGGVTSLQLRKLQKFSESKEGNFGLVFSGRFSPPGGGGG